MYTPTGTKFGNVTSCSVAADGSGTGVQTEMKWDNKQG